MSMQSFFQPDLLLQVSGITPGRAAALLPGMMGLISVVIGWLALAESRKGSGRLKAIVALVLGLTGIVLAALHIARTTGGFGTGSGKLGAVVAIVLGVAGVVLSGLALVRLRRTVKDSRSVS